MNLFNFLNRQRRWSSNTFGDTPRTEGILKHIESECNEVRAEPKKLSEWCDLMILAFDGAWRAGHSPAAICRALEEKQAVNMTRTYPKTPDDVPSEHVRTRQPIVASKVLFLDCDGVINDHSHFENRYCGTDPTCVSWLNRVLREVPDLKIVLSSAWRYNFHRGSMNMEGLTELFLTHGINMKDRLIGVTEPDPVSYHENGGDWQNHSLDQWREWGLKWRVEQINKWLAENEVGHYVVVDDLPLDLPESVFVQTDGKVGLDFHKAHEIINKLRPASVMGGPMAEVVR